MYQHNQPDQNRDFIAYPYLDTKVRIMYIMLNEVYDQQLDNTEPFPSM